MISAISSRLQKLTSRSEDGVISRQRHRECLTECLNRLEEAMKLGYDDIDLVSENLRNASVHLGRITGKVDVEDLLEVIFSEFCVGK